MRFAAPLLAACLLYGTSLLGGNAQAQEDAFQIEEIRRLRGELEDLRDANSAQTRKISQLQSEIKSLRDAIRESNERSTGKMAEFINRDDLKKLADSVEAIDRKRESDKNLILEEIKKMGLLITSTPPPSSSNGSSGKPKNDISTAEPRLEGTFYPHIVQKGENLSEIVEAYNQAFREKGKGRVTLSMVRKANPKININNIYVGQEILIPEPPDK